MSEKRKSRLPPNSPNVVWDSMTVSQLLKLIKQEGLEEYELEIFTDYGIFPVGDYKFSDVEEGDERNVLQFIAWDSKNDNWVLQLNKDQRDVLKFTLENRLKEVKKELKEIHLLTRRQTTTIKQQKYLRQIYSQLIDGEDINDKTS